MKLYVLEQTDNNRHDSNTYVLGVYSTYENAERKAEYKEIKFEQYGDSQEHWHRWNVPSDALYGSYQDIFVVTLDS